MLDFSEQVLGRRAGPARHRLPPRLRDEPALFLHWSDRRGDTRVAEFRRDACASRAAGRELLFVDQPEENHNGGQLAFGPDGRLYLGLGDGGGAFDPGADAQDADLLGKLVATDVDGGPPDWDVVLTGLRNPWRFWFDPALGEIWIGDVGQDELEEVDRVLLELDEPPKNLGWSAYEGTDRIDGHALDREGELVWPSRPTGTTTGLLGHRRRRLRRRRAAPLVRRYVYGDFCAGTLWSLRGTPDAAPRTCAASGRSSPSSPTSAPTPTASWCSPRAAATSTARWLPDS